MTIDERIRDALHHHAGDYATLNRLLDCYEDWGARRATEERCGCLLNPSADRADAR